MFTSLSMAELTEITIGAYYCRIWRKTATEIVFEGKITLTVSVSVPNRLPTPNFCLNRGM